MSTRPAPRARLALALAFALAPGLGLGACSSDPAPVDPSFDGNVVVGDATPARDAIPRDLGVAPDAGELDAEVEDTGVGPDLDASAADADAGAGDAGPVCDLTPVATLTASVAVASASAWAGQTIDVVATATVAALRCTDLACPAGDACCNTCTAEVSLDGLLPLVAGPCSTVMPGCEGDECTQVCRPAILGVPETFRGRLVAPAGGAVGFELFLVVP